MTDAQRQIAVYSKVWFNTPLLAAAERNQNMRVLGIKPDGIINFLSNEAPWQIMQGLQDTPRLASGSLTPISPPGYSTAELPPGAARVFLQ